MSKLPWFKFNPSKWITDPELSKCTPATRGVWIDLLCAMHQSGRSGELSGTTDQIARLGRCSTAELTQALTELQTTGTADVTFRNTNVTVINRLMKREAKDRHGTALRVKKHRSNADCNGNETGESKEVRSKKLDRENTGPAPNLAGSNLFRKPVIPTLAQVKEVFYKQGGNQDQALRFFAKHEATGWYLNGSPIVSWTSLVAGFLSNWKDYEQEPPTEGKPTIWL